MENERGSILDRVPGYVVPALLLGVPGLAWILSALWPRFYAEVIWQYYWGPIVADGSEVGSAGMERYGITVHGGYNLVNTISWAILLFVCIFGIAQLLHRFKVPMDAKMILAANAWVVTGSVFHVLQDSQLFNQPLEFLFITPPIWLLYGAGGVGSMVLGVYYEHIRQKTGSLEVALQKVWFLFIIFVLAYTALWIAQWEQVVAYLNPIWAAAAAAIAFFVFRAIATKAGRIVPSHCVATFSIGWFLMAVFYYVAYTWDPSWGDRNPTDDLRFAIWLVPALAGAVTGAVYLVAKQFKARGKEDAAAFMMPINLVIIFGQMVDAFSTAVGVDLRNYTEKHVLSEWVRHTFETFAANIGWEWGAAHPTFLAFVPVKLLVSLMVIYAIDVSGKEDTARQPTLMNLIKFAVIMVGLGPGTRNTLRMTLGI